MSCRPLDVESFRNRARLPKGITRRKRAGYDESKKVSRTLLIRNTYSRRSEPPPSRLGMLRISSDRSSYQRSSGTEGSSSWLPSRRILLRRESRASRGDAPAPGVSLHLPSVSTKSRSARVCSWLPSSSAAPADKDPQASTLTRGATLGPKSAGQVIMPFSQGDCPCQPKQLTTPMHSYRLTRTQSTQPFNGS